MSNDVESRYPALMTYIHSRNQLETTANWCSALADDKTAARDGAFADMAEELERAQADYKAQENAQGRDGYPYNRAMGEFLGLPLRANHEPAHGYYMASSVLSHYRFGEALREVERLIAEGKPLKVVAARSKKDRKPCRFWMFVGPGEIKVSGTSVIVQKGKTRLSLSSNWSTETCMQRVATAMRSGDAYGS